jgi:hypothetical protein
MLSCGEASNQIKYASPLTRDLSFLLLADGPEDEIIRCQSYELRNTDLYLFGQIFYTKYLHN